MLKIWELGLSGKMYKLRQNLNSVIYIFNLNAFFIFFLTGATLYHHAIHIVELSFMQIITDTFLQIVTDTFIPIVTDTFYPDSGPPQRPLHSV